MSLTLLAAAREHSPARPRIRWEENPTIRPVSARARRLNPGAVRAGERDHGRMESKAARDLAERLAGTVLSQDPGAPARMRARLAQLSGREWLRLDESMRRRYRSPLDDVTGWPSRLGTDDGGIAAAAGSMDRDGRVREAAVAVLAQTPGPVAAAALAARAAVRAFALEHLDDDLLPREVLRGMIADRSGMVRSIARWRWTQAGQDPVPVYRELLASPLRVRHAAVHAVGRHSPPGDLPARLTPALRDESGKVARAALRYLRGYRLAPAVLGELDAAGTRRSRLTALAIRQRLSPWDRVGADLAAIGDPDPELARTGRADQLSWLQRDAATAYGRPSAEQAAQIAARLATSPLTSEQRREVAFVAGIRPEPAV